MFRTAAELAALRDRPRRLLSVLPHPDDESYGPAGALARTAFDPDGASVVFCLTRGEASRMGPDRGLAPDEVAAVRAQRLDAVAGHLRLAGMLKGGFPDGRLARCRLDDVAAAIVEVLDVFAPQVVIGHDPRGVNAHPDHIATHWALRHALLDRPGVRFAMTVYPPEVAEIAKPRLLFPTEEEEIDVVLSLSEEEAAAKEACLRVHEAFVTLDPDHPDPAVIRRPPVERYDLLDEEFDPPLDDLFSRRPT